MGADEPSFENVRTLSRWKHLLKVPSTIECPSMQIVSPNPEEPVFTGIGRIDIRSRTEMEFVMHATPREGREAFERLVRAEKNPHNIYDQLGVRGIDYHGTEWNAGWTSIHLGVTRGNTWRLSGPIDSLFTEVSGPDVARTSSIEVIYDSRLRIPLPLNMSTSVRRGDREVLWKLQGGGTTIDIAGTHIDFFVDPKLDATWAVAATSEAFLHPHAENWVSEPFWMLLGQLVFPRLIARNLGERSMIWVRPSPPIDTSTLAASILQQDPLAAEDRFWDVYRRILTMIVGARDEHGDCNFEPHPLSRYYHEVIQATLGSNWVWCLTLASAIEGVTNLLVPKAERKAGFAPKTVEDLKKHIEKWCGDDDLRRRILNCVSDLKKGTGQILKKFKDDGLIADDQFEAWRAVRNSVMHGELVTPWSDERLEDRMRLLSELMHRLSMKYIDSACSV
jgi:hypothetical protein